MKQHALSVYHSDKERFCLQSFVRLSRHDGYTAWPQDGFKCFSQGHGNTIPQRMSSKSFANFQLLARRSTNWAMPHLPSVITSKTTQS